MNLDDFRKSVEYAKDDDTGSYLLVMTYYDANELLALLDQQAAVIALAREALECSLEMDVQHRNNIYLVQRALEAMKGKWDG